MAEYRQQASELVYALDIGTRGVVGVVGRPEGTRFNVLAMEMSEHARRTMVDGQIDNIKQVADLARTVTDRLQDRLGVTLQRVCVAAAGRALRTEKGSFALELSQNDTISAEQISRLETGAVSAAEDALQADGDARRQFFLVGYTVAQYRLDNYPLTSLLDHSGRMIEADVVATFLPGEVVESLYSAMRMADLQIASMTLEPIAAMNAAIPEELRLLNLALVDIGAGTTDIAICKGGSVVGYTMATIAGDEITEAVMHRYLVDFQTAETMKRSLGKGEDICYKDILGMENQCTCQEFLQAIEEPVENLAQAIAQQVLELNGAAPSALFLAGGGSKLVGIQEHVAQHLNMDLRRVTIAGSNYEKSVFSQDLNLLNPEYATPLGIAVSAGMGLLNDSYMISLNGEPAKLFRSGVLSLRDILLMNGYTYSDMLAKSGKNLSVVLDGQRLTVRGEAGIPAILLLNDEEVSITQVVRAGDQITFTPAVPGTDAARTVRQVLGDNALRRVLVNNQEVDLDTPLCQGDVIMTLEKLSRPSEEGAGQAAKEEDAAPPEEPAPVKEMQGSAEMPVCEEPDHTVLDVSDVREIQLEDTQEVMESAEEKDELAVDTVMKQSGSISQTFVQEQNVLIAEDATDAAISSKTDTAFSAHKEAAEKPNAAGMVYSATQQAQRDEPSMPEPLAARSIGVVLNGRSLWLPGKENGLPYYLMDLLERTGIDFEHLDCPVQMQVNGMECSFGQELKSGDVVTICCDHDRRYTL